MGLFSKGNSTTGQGTPGLGDGAITSIFDKGVLVVGDISFKGKMRLDGSVKGNISGEYLIVSETGVVNGDITAAVVVCQGQVDGKISAKKFYAKKGGVINGTLETSDLSVESGASLNGDIKAQTKSLHLVKDKDTFFREGSEAEAK